MARARTTTQQPLGVTPSGIDVLDRAASILFAFGPDDPPLTLTELSTRTGLYKSTLLRLAGSLCHHRLLIRLDDGRFRLGSATLNLAAHYESSLNLGDVLLPPMRELNAELGEAVSFHVREGDHRVCLYRISSRFSIRAEVQQGDVQPLDRGAGGRILLAFSGESGEPYDTIRADFCYASFGERDPETAGISAPVFGAQQRLVGALGVVGPTSRMDYVGMERYRPRLLMFAARATERLGGDASALIAAAGTSTVALT
ncbi:IclR family transcriptional regulator [Paraburkholderia sp.]|uniref:IclR family transcriptional regulator n=1 Tax=Paraburkholderia sp. TaxID=1926495 RepID=UPI002387EC65|nr:IclR family transcriptional regulator [Paraburkholderia sp.]MDE1181807.1 IclR family transcriptional regulator [Paraburkholderia sp.]